MWFTSSLARTVPRAGHQLTATSACISGRKAIIDFTHVRGASRDDARDAPDTLVHARIASKKSTVRWMRVRYSGRSACTESDVPASICSNLRRMWQLPGSNHTKSRGTAKAPRQCSSSRGRCAVISLTFNCWRNRSMFRRVVTLG